MGSVYREDWNGYHLSVWMIATDRWAYDYSDGTTLWYGDFKAYTRTDAIGILKSIIIRDQAVG